MNALLTLEGVHTHIGAYHILHGVDLVVPRGQLTMLLGRNGAGKTTTLRTIMGLWKASEGRITFGRPRHHGAADAADRRPGRGLRAGEHGHLRRPDGAARTCCWPRAAPRPPPRSTRAACSGSSRCSRRWRSSGTTRPASSRAGRSRCWRCRAPSSSRANCWSIDEPSKGLAPAIINNMIDAFGQLKASGVTILLVEQNINFAKRLGDTRGGDGQRPRSCTPAP